MRNKNWIKRFSSLIVIQFCLGFLCFGQGNIDTNYYVLPQEYENCAFNLHLPKTINSIDLSICQTYGNDKNKERKYYLLVKIRKNYQPKIHLFYINDENGKMICVDNKIIRVKLIKLIDEIKVTDLSCDNSEINLTIPLTISNAHNR